MSIARNAPCPCGSGKRYKECHGAIESAGGDTTSPALAALLQEALRAQQAGALDKARAKYEAALREKPDHFDALHMPTNRSSSSSPDPGANRCSATA